MDCLPKISNLIATAYAIPLLLSACRADILAAWALVGWRGLSPMCTTCSWTGRSIMIRSTRRHNLFTRGFFLDDANLTDHR